MRHAPLDIFAPSCLDMHGEYILTTLILEAVADYDLWLWHSCFYHPGLLKDINVWDKSPLLQEFLDGTFSEDVDFEFEINGTVVHHVHGEKMCLLFFVFFCFELTFHFLLFY